MFLAENATKQGVVVLSSGLQYQILIDGNGEKPALHHVVTCHYHGTLINGEIFDSSVKRGRPASFPVNGVIKQGVCLESGGSIPKNLNPILLYYKKII